MSQQIEPSIILNGLERLLPLAQGCPLEPGEAARGAGTWPTPTSRVLEQITEDDALRDAIDYILSAYGVRPQDFAEIGLEGDLDDTAIIWVHARWTNVGLTPGELNDLDCNEVCDGICKFDLDDSRQLYLSFDGPPCETCGGLAARP